MTPSTPRFCPLCLLALLGIVILIGNPGLASVQTPLGPASLLLLWIPLLSALLRQGLLGALRPRQRLAAPPSRR